MTYVAQVRLEMYVKLLVGMTVGHSLPMYLLVAFFLLYYLKGSLNGKDNMSECSIAFYSNLNLYLYYEHAVDTCFVLFAAELISLFSVRLFPRFQYLSNCANI